MEKTGSNVYLLEDIGRESGERIEEGSEEIKVSRRRDFRDIAESS